MGTYITDILHIFFKLAYTFIYLQDFVVGKSYKKKVTLTNVSYTVNYIKFVDITERLKDFVKIQ